MMNKIAVVALGNKMRCDDGIGIKVIEEMKNKTSEEHVGVDFFCDGWGGLSVFDDLKKYRALIVVDAVDFGDEAGAVMVFDEFDARKVRTHSSHSIDLLQINEVFKQITGEYLIIKIVGIQFKNLNWGEILSEEVKDSAQEVKEVVCRLINELKE